MEKLTISDYKRITQDYARIYGNNLFIRDSEITHVSDVFVECYFDQETELSDLVTDFIEESKGFKDLETGHYAFDILVNVSDQENWEVMEVIMDKQPEQVFQNVIIDHENQLPF